MNGSRTLVLYHGAGSGRDQPSLLAIETAIAPMPCVRAEFPYRREGRKAPDRATKLMAAVRTELASIDRPVVIGGRSMGGRICSMVAAGADGLEPPPQVDGVVLISYPLHPPGRPDSLRVEHLPQLRVPCLVIQGERDTFGTPDELAPWMATVPGGVTTVVIEGGRHELRGADAAIAEHVAAWVRDLAHG